MKTRTKLIEQLRTPTFTEFVLDSPTFEANTSTGPVPSLPADADANRFWTLAAKLDLVSEALAVILDEQRPSGNSRGEVK